MEILLTLFDAYGPWLLLAIGFAEYVGVPIAAVPLLIAAGGISRMDGPALPLIVLSAALGGLAADAIWYGMARWRGGRLVGAACTLSSNPTVCVGGVERRVARVGSRYVLTAKFIPGAGNLIAPAAGLAGFPAVRFLALDGVALLLWATAYAGVGWLFSRQVEALVRLVEGYTTWALVLVAGLIAAGVVARLVKRRAHAHGHEVDPASSTDADVSPTA